MRREECAKLWEGRGNQLKKSDSFLRSSFIFLSLNFDPSSDLVALPPPLFRLLPPPRAGKPLFPAPRPGPGASRLVVSSLLVPLLFSSSLCLFDADATARGSPRAAARRRRRSGRRSGSRSSRRRRRRRSLPPLCRCSCRGLLRSRRPFDVARRPFPSHSTHHSPAAAAAAAPEPPREQPSPRPQPRARGEDCGEEAPARGGSPSDDGGGSSGGGGGGLC